MNTSIRADHLISFVPGSAPLRAAARNARYESTLRFGSLTICVRVDDPTVLAAFNTRYAYHRSTGAPDLTYYACEHEGDLVFFGESMPAWRWTHGPVSSDAYLFLLDACAMSALVFARHLVSFHAAVLERSGAAVAIVGPSGRGKTTTALACASAGMRLYSDERCIIEGSAVVPFIRTLNVRAGGAALLHAEATAEHMLGRIPRSGGSVDVADLLGADAIAPPRPLEAVVYLEGYAQRPDLQQVALLEIAPLLLQWMQSCESTPLQRMKRLLETLAGVRCYRLTLGSPSASAACISALLGSEVHRRAS